ncbi:MAG: pseudouridine synthase, partial [Chitinispirillaceae bacterium]|nr:pseudouridine synthase [Chitinispirillaceae bacterium]
MEQFIIGSEEAGCRIDRVLRRKLKLLPLSVIYMLFRKGGVVVNGKKREQNYRLQEGDVVEVDVDRSEVFTEEKGHERDLLIQLTDTSFFKNNFFILYEDEDILACNKPAGLVVHPGTGHEKRQDSLIELATAYLLKEGKISFPRQAGLVHRLDRDTSGVILIAKNKRTLRKLQA